MKTKDLLACTVVALAMTACGRNYQGSYRGTETVNQNYSTVAGQTAVSGIAAQNYSDTVSLNLTDSSGNVTGTYQGTSISGNFQGTDTATGISNAILTITSASYNSTYGSTYPSTYSTSSYYGCTGATFVGTLTVNNNVITGTLTPQNTSTCGMTAISVNATKQ